MYLKNNLFKPTRTNISNQKKRKMLNQQSKEQYSDQTGILFTDVNVKLRDIEEKQNLIRDRLILIGENLIAEKEETENDTLKIKDLIKGMLDEIKNLKLIVQRLIESQDNFARRSQLENLERQFKMFQPLELARISDVESIVNKTLKKLIDKQK